MAILDTDLLLVNRPSEDETYKYTFGNLKEELPPGTVVSEDPPTGDLQQGLLWFDSSIASLFIWYDDGDTAQWVDVYSGRIPEGGGGGGANVIVSENAPTQRTDGEALQEGDLWWNKDTEENGGGRMFVYYDSAWVDTSLPGAPGSGGGGASVSVGESAPSGATEGDLWWNSRELADGGGRMYIYYQGQWVDASVLGGGGFSGDYNDLTNKPNIPPEFNLDEGSYVNDIIHWSDSGSVLEISSTDTGATASGNAFTNVAAEGGNGTGLTCNVIRRKNTGAHEVYVATPGENYQVGDVIHLDLGYDPANPGGSTGSNGIDCRVDSINDEAGNGWVALPGADFFVSSSIDSLNTGVPQFMIGAQFGGSTDRRRIDSAAFPVVIEPIGDKANFGVVMTANRDSSGTPRVVFEAGNAADGLGELVFKRASNTTLDDYVANETFSRLRGQSDKLVFQECIDGENSYQNRFIIYQDDISSVDPNLSGAGFALQNGNSIASESLLFDFKSIKSVTSNSALRFFSGNAKFNFQKTNGTSGYQINAEAGSAGFILPVDAAEPTNYNAEGEYIGPVVDQAQDIRDALTALKAAAADNATDLAGLKAAILSALTAF